MSVPMYDYITIIIVISKTTAIEYTPINLLILNTFLILTTINISIHVSDSIRVMLMDTKT
jgi:hypothetical protein